MKSKLHEAERNRPRELATASLLDATFRNTIHDAVAQLVNGGISASVVAEAVVTAIRNESLYVFTHPETAPHVQERYARIQAAFAKA